MKRLQTFWRWLKGDWWVPTQIGGCWYMYNPFRGVNPWGSDGHSLIRSMCWVHNRRTRIPVIGESSYT